MALKRIQKTKHRRVKRLKETASTNPMAASSNITISIPQDVAINLVDATTLSDYEIWILLGSILSNAVVGFFIAYMQTPASSDAKSAYLWMTIVFSLLFILSLGTAIWKRHRLNSKKKMVKFKIGEPIAPDEALA